MKLTMSRPAFAVYDDFLPPDVFARVWDYVQREDYQWVHHQQWLKAWRLQDGAPMIGPLIFSDETTARVANGYPINKQPGEAPFQPLTYPTREDLDLFIDAFMHGGGGWLDVIGEHGKDWLGFTTRCFVYPQGTGLSWHEDSVIYSGAYIYYAHPEWNVLWGGELMLADDSLAEGYEAPDGQDENDVSIYHADRSMRVGQHLDISRTNAKLLDVGLGYYLQPKPNRLVVLKRYASHNLNPVTRAAGDHTRASITGFFIMPPDEARNASAAE